MPNYGVYDCDNQRMVDVYGTSREATYRARVMAACVGSVRNAVECTPPAGLTTEVAFAHANFPAIPATAVILTDEPITDSL